MSAAAPGPAASASRPRARRAASRWRGRRSTPVASVSAGPPLGGLYLKPPSRGGLCDGVTTMPSARPLVVGFRGCASRIAWRHRGRRGVAGRRRRPATVDVVGGEHLQRGGPRRLGQRVGVAADEQRPVDALRGPVLADRLGGRQDVRLVEGAASRLEPRCPEVPNTTCWPGSARSGSRCSRPSPGGRRRPGPRLRGLPGALDGHDRTPVAPYGSERPRRCAARAPIIPCRRPGSARYRDPAVEPRGGAVAGLRTVRATRYVTPLREGGSLPGLVEADDDGTYVVKFTGAGRGPRRWSPRSSSGELGRRDRCAGCPTGGRRARPRDRAARARPGGPGAAQGQRRGQPRAGLPARARSGTTACLAAGPARGRPASSGSTPHGQHGPHLAQPQPAGLAPRPLGHRPRRRPRTSSTRGRPPTVGRAAGTTSPEHVLRPSSATSTPACSPRSTPSSPPLVPLLTGVLELVPGDWLTGMNAALGDPATPPPGGPATWSSSPRGPPASGRGSTVGAGS